MVAINLLPDLRQAKIRDLHRRQLAIALSTIVVVVSGGSVLALFLLMGGMKLQIANLNGQISERQKQLEAIPNLTKALTVQQHLAALPQLYAGRNSFTRFLAVLSAATPGDITLASVAEESAGSLSIAGKASSYAAVGKFARAIEASPGLFAPSLQPITQDKFNFGEVVITSSSQSDRGVNFAITAKPTANAILGGDHGQN